MRWTPIVLLLAACGPTAKAKPDGGGGGGDDGGGGNADAATCGAQTTPIETTNQGDPPDLLVVLDRSGSMRSCPNGNPFCTNPSKWSIMDGALTSVVMSKQTQIKFGLLEFPSNDDCAADAGAEVGIALNAGPAVDTYFNNRDPDGNTPAATSLQSALGYYNSIPANPAGRYVLFATDGLPGCTGDPENDTVNAVTALFNAGIKTYVLGFGSFGGTSVLNAAATAGGTARPGATKFYEASSAAELDQALNDIAGGVIVPTCVFALASAPPDPTNVTVTIGGTPVPRDTNHVNGWDYYPDAMTITFFGTYCDQIKSGAVGDVTFVYGCPGPVIN
ncbi:MAG TPA: vWA domain-containing protein [Kofleriaceae bacterium]